MPVTPPVADKCRHDARYFVCRLRRCHLPHALPPLRLPLVDIDDATPFAAAARYFDAAFQLRCRARRSGTPCYFGAKSVFARYARYAAIDMFMPRYATRCLARRYMPLFFLMPDGFSPPAMFDKPMRADAVSIF